MERPLLKYACSIAQAGGATTIHYRGIAYPVELGADGVASEVLARLDGRTPVEAVAAVTGVDRDAVDAMVRSLADVPLVVEGREVLREDGLLSGSELFWRMERLLWNWRYSGPRMADGERLETEIAAGRAPLSVVAGYCVEIAHQLRNTPTEIAVAIANSPTERVRDRFREFYEEEHEHGAMLMEAIGAWLPAAGVAGAAPLPATLGLLNTYNWWAQSDVLLYATALMRDEQSVLDAEAPPERDIPRGIAAHYDVPPEVAEFFRWHISFDRDEGHGFFPETVFREYPVIDRSRAASIVNALRLIIDLYDTFYAGILDVYSRTDVSERWGLADELQPGGVKGSDLEAAPVRRDARRQFA